MKTFQVTEVNDWGGGDRTKFVCFVSENVSEEALKKRWPHGAFYPKVLTIFDSLEEVAANTKLKLRQSAWDKLSAAEREALGILKRPT